MPNLNLQESEVKSEIARLSRIAIDHMAECDRCLTRAYELFDKTKDYDHQSEETDWLADKSIWHWHEAGRLFAISETLHQEWRGR